MTPRATWIAAGAFMGVVAHAYSPNAWHTGEAIAAAGMGALLALGLRRILGR